VLRLCSIAAALPAAVITPSNILCQNRWNQPLIFIRQLHLHPQRPTWQLLRQIIALHSIAPSTGIGTHSHTCSTKNMTSSIDPIHQSLHNTCRMDLAKSQSHNNTVFRSIVRYHQDIVAGFLGLILSHQCHNIHLPSVA